MHSENYNLTDVEKEGNLRTLKFFGVFSRNKRNRNEFYNQTFGYFLCKRVMSLN